MTPRAHPYGVSTGHYHSPPLDPQVKAAIIEAIQRDPVPSHRALAEEFGVAHSTIYRVALDNDLADRWEHRRERTEAATASKATELAAKRLQLQDEAMTAALEFLAKRDEKIEQAVKGIEGAEVVETKPGHHEWRALGSAIASLITGSVGLARFENELSSAGHSGGLLSEFRQALREAEENEEKLSRLGELDQ